MRHLNIIIACAGLVMAIPNLNFRLDSGTARTSECSEIYKQTREYCSDAAKTYEDYKRDFKKCIKEGQNAWDKCRATEQLTIPKLPWQHGGKWAFECGFHTREETDCGTERYCLMMDGKAPAFGGGFFSVSRNFQTYPVYSNSKECFDAHEPEPKADTAQPLQVAKLPWMLPSNDPDGCGYFGYDERVCGTRVFCNIIDLNGIEKSSRIEGLSAWKTTKECRDAREPAPKLPWVEKGSDGSGSSTCDSETDCGTEKWCKSYDDLEAVGEWEWPPSFLDSQDCFDAHEPKPTPSKLPWIERGEEFSKCSRFSLNETQCGTKTFCYYEPDQYKDAKECLDAREPEPKTPSQSSKASQCKFGLHTRNTYDSEGNVIGKVEKYYMREFTVECTKVKGRCFDCGMELLDGCMPCDQCSDDCGIER